MVHSPVKSVTLAEFLQQPETKPASEYIDGQIFIKPMPLGQHSAIQAELVTTIDLALSDRGIAEAFPELRCTFGGRSIVPDIAVFCQEHIPLQADGKIANAFEIAPDWTIEILSPDQSTTRVLKNINLCLKAGTQMGWLIDPETESVFVCELGKQFMVLDEPLESLPVPAFASNLALTVGDVFDWLKG